MSDRSVGAHVVGEEAVECNRSKAKRGVLQEVAARERVGDHKLLLASRPP